MQIAPNPIQHLELEMAGVDSVLFGVALDCGNHGVVVRRQPVELRARQQHAAEFDKVRVHVGLARKRNLRRLLVGALAQPHPNPVGDQLLDVLLGAEKVGLNHDSNRLAQLRLCVEPFDNLHRHPRQGRIFHVDADKAARLGGVLGYALGNALGQCG